MPETTQTDTKPGPRVDVDPALAAALTNLEESLNERGMWNLEPRIFLWQPPVMAGIMVDDRIWQRVDGHPADVLAMIADQWDDVKAGLIAQDPIVFGQPPQAVVLITEAWSLNIGAALERGDHDKAAEYRRAADNRMIHKHPDRQEVRNVAAVDALHRSMSIIRWRGEDKVVFDGGDGLVPDAMKEFITRVTARRPL